MNEFTSNPLSYFRVKTKLKTFIALLFLLVIAPMKVRADSMDDANLAFNLGKYETALKFYQPCAEAGDAKCQLVLSAMYRGGLGVKKDVAEARKWRQKAADQGLAAAQWYIGQMYELGEEVPRDYVEAAFWYALAVKFDRDPPILGIGAVFSRDDAMSHLSAEQVVEVQRRLKEWKPNPSSRSKRPE